MDIPPEHWSTVDELFDAALDQPPAERRDFVHHSCEDEAIREMVMQLLDATEEPSPLDVVSRGGNTLWIELAEEVDASLDASRHGPDSERAGPYRLAERLGRGGSGVVYRAERDDGSLQQTVAIKLLTRDVDSAAVLNRFAHEQQVLAGLTHPNIARLYDGGTAVDGRPYFVMEYVDGRPLDAYCDAERLPIEERLRLFIGVGEAVRYAHRKLVVHRDLKPSNMLVTDAGEDGPQPRLLDFGIAKVVGDEAPDLTRTGERWMTPEYAAPEQIRGEAVTTATDVYQLGVVLYELLCGRRPYRMARASVYQIERAVVEDTPLPPSTAVPHAPSRAGDAANEAANEAANDAPSDRPSDDLRDVTERIVRARRTNASALQRTLGGDLDAIVLKALRKEPERRYASVEAFVEDVRRYLDGRPVEARRDTWTYRTRKFVQRNASVVAAATLLVVLAVGLGIFHTHRVTAERNRAQDEAAKAETVSAFLVDLFRSSRPVVSGTDVPSAVDLLERGRERAASLGDRPAVQHSMLNAIGRSYLGLGQYETADSILNRSLSLARDVHGPASPEAARALSSLGSLHLQQYNYRTADTLYTEALSIYDTLVGPYDLQTARVLRSLGTVQGHLGRLDVGEDYVRRSLSILERLPDAPPQHRIETRNALALLLRMDDRPAEAERLYRTALADQERFMPNNDHTRALLLNNLAYLLRVEKQPDEAATLYREALAISQRVNGPDHPSTITVLTNLAAIAHLQGRTADADSLLRRKTRLVRSRYAPTHWRVGSALVSGLGRLRMQSGDCAAALPVLEEGLQVWARGLGPSHPWTARARAMLGICQTATGRPDAGRKAIDRAASDFRAAISEGHSGLNPVFLSRLSELCMQFDLPDLASTFDDLYQAVAEGEQEDT